MGAYFSTTSISIVLPGFLKSNTTTSDAEGTSIFSRQIENAEGKVNSAIANRYDISAFTAIPPLLRKLTEDIAIYSVVMKTGYRANNRNQYMDDFKMANETLKSLMSGEMNLCYTDGSAVPTKSSSRILSNTKNYPHIFNLDEPEDWAPGSDRDNDIADTRD